MEKDKEGLKKEEGREKGGWARGDKLRVMHRLKEVRENGGREEERKRYLQKPLVLSVRESGAL